MNHFRTIDPYDFSCPIFQKIGQEGMLLTATGQQSERNCMTATWGGMGVLWHMPVCFLFVRPSRKTCEILETGNKVTLSFLGQERKDILFYCGSHSGRNTDKEAVCGLHPFRTAGGFAYEEANLIISGEIYYRSAIRESGFATPVLAEHYKDGDYHRVFVVRILEILERLDDSYKK